MGECPECHKYIGKCPACHTVRTTSPPSPGYKVVPIEPTQEMIEVLWCGDTDYDTHTVNNGRGKWKDVLAAAPQSDIVPVPRELAERLAAPGLNAGAQSQLRSLLTGRQNEKGK